MQNENDNWLLSSLEAAQTPEEYEAVRQLWEEQQRTKKPKDIWDLSTLTDVAEFFGLEEQTIRTWRLKSPPMPGEPGRWPIRQIVKWRCDSIQQSDLAAAKRQQDYDLGRIQVETKQMELDREKGLTLDRHDVELWASQGLVELRETILQLPEMLAASAPQELRDFVRSESDHHCRGALTAAARRLDVMEIKSEILTE